MRRYRLPESLAAFGALVLLMLASGCAIQPPGSSGTLSGRRLMVTMTFEQPPNPQGFYFFVINHSQASGDPTTSAGNTGDLNAPGPVPVGSPISGTSYGNGFATGSRGGSTGFTDFILYTNPANQFPGFSANGGPIGIYHVVPIQTGGVNNRQNFVYTGAPLTYTLPSGNPGASDFATLTFTIDLAQLEAKDASGNTISASQATTLAQQIRYLQINIIATNLVPVDTQTAISKQYDALGNTATNRSVFLNLDLSSITTVTNGDTISSQQSCSEPGTQNDVVNTSTNAPPGDPELNLVNWTVNVVQQ